MIKRLLVICFFSFSFSFINLKAQPYGNEWINYSQKYYKIQIAGNGIYRIDSATLAAAGIPLSSIDPRNFHLFNKGVEESIYIQGEKDGVFNGTDFIEFYAEQNDGKMDTLLYKNTTFLPNPYYSLINDTAVYFLTWNSTSGKRMFSETDTLFSSYTPDSYFFKEEIQSFTTGYYEGETNISGGTDPRYTQSEGWFDGNVMDLGVTNLYNNLLNTSNAYAFGPPAKMETVVIGASKSQVVVGPDHHITIDYKGMSGTYQQLTNTLFKGYACNRFTYSVSASALGSPYTDFRFTSVADPVFKSNRTTVSYIYIKYPHTFDLEGKSNFIMYLPQNTSQSKSYLDISNFNATDTVRLYDLTNNKRIAVVQNGSNYRALVPNGGGEKKCFITSDAGIYSVTAIQPVTASAQFTDYSSLADSAYLIVTHKSLISSVLSYKNYRSSIAGGSHNVVIADIDELYDQFAYGIVKSPLSIRNFSHYMLDTYPAAPPQNLFLIGKSIHMNYCRINSVNDPALYPMNLVPSFGNPSSDYLLTSELNSTNIAPAIPTGRLSAKNSTEVDQYLQKIQAYESTPPDEWKKYALHFGGGTNNGEQSLFRTYLNGYKNIIEDTLFGGKVMKEFFKTSSAPIQSNLSDTFSNLINNGVALMTFFGHTSGQTFDQSVDKLLTYNPMTGRYPFLLVNGCYAGDFHTPDLSTSETFTLPADKGVIAYLASVSLGVPDALNHFSTEFFDQLSRKNYGKSVGSSVRKAIANMSQTALTDTLIRVACYEMSLQGDPSVKIGMYDKPDYKITNNDVFFDVTTQPDSFIVYASRTNIGKAVSDSSFTELVRTLPSGATVTYLLRGKFTKFKDTVSFKIPIDFAHDVGLNKIRITLDRNNELGELDEGNNATTEVDMFINGGGIIPVYPYEFAIVPTPTTTLKASTANPFATSKKYIFQIDTTDTFNSPFMKSSIVTAPGGIVQWAPSSTFPSFTFTDSTVYYWRVSPDSTSALSGYIWRESSFQHIDSVQGWEQAHFFQFKNDGYQYVKFKRSLRKFDFVNDVNEIRCIDGVPPYIRYDGINYAINGAVQFVSSWSIPGITFAVFDPISGDPVQSISQGLGLGQFGNITYYPAGTKENAFDFAQGDSLSRSVMTNFINNSIPNGAYVLAYSQQDNSSPHSIPQYENSVVAAFQTLGSTQIQNVQPFHSYILFGKKGSPGSAKEIIGDSINSIITLDTVITTQWKNGYIASPVIGPAKSWGSLHWRQKTLDGASTADSITVRVIGIQPDGTETALADFEDSTDVLDLANYVNVDSFPRIRLIAFMQDDSLNTPPQLKRWHVVFDPVPEAAINPPVGYAFANDTLQEGDNIKINLPIQNISDYNFTDSLLITYWIEDANRANHPLPYRLKKKPFVANEIIIDTINLNTTNYKGSNALWVEVNPVKQPRSQPEQYHFNNIIRIPFYTNTDRINPLLDVTFDGIHILNNDIVSAAPHILIKLKDENQFLALNDTADFKIFIQSPSSSIAKRVYFGEVMSFTPAVLPNNSCRINYTPSMSEDGTYQLIVQAKDKSDNLSGTLDYKINFEVISRATITEVMNYPNPFSTATHFVFTLTGSEVPTYFKIQIMTITGKVVREINREELGMLHVGRNITEYAWDGKDEFGDQLANGVYLYRVVTSINGWTIEKRESGADPYFKKGFGKMYLMR